MVLDDKTRELIAIGASIASNNPPSLKYHIDRARSLGGSDDEILDAVETGKFVRRSAASKTDIFAESFRTPPPRGGCRKGRVKGEDAPRSECGCAASEPGPEAEADVACGKS